jgi:hypothetical protein
VKKKCTLKPLLPDPNSPHAAAPNANAPFVGFKDSTKWLLIFCSDSMQLVLFDFGVDNNWLCLAGLVPQWVDQVWKVVFDSQLDCNQ